MDLQTAGRPDFDTNARESLLDVILDKVHKAGKVQTLCRVVYVARLLRRESSADQLRDFYSKLFQPYQQDVEVTGLLLVYPTCCVHVLEGKTAAIMGILKGLLAAPSSESALAETRVVCSTEDIPSRCYNSWYAGYVPASTSSDSIDGLDSSQMVQAAAELNTSLRKIGPTLLTLPEFEIRRRLQSMDAAYDEVPSPEKILTMLPSEDAPTLLEYLDIFDGPVNLELDSDKVWPMPMPLKY